MSDVHALRAAARRRRAGAGPADGGVDRCRARAGGGRRARQHRARPARPGARAAHLRRRGRRPHRGRARLPPRRARVPQRAAGGAARRRRLRPLRRPAAGLLRLPGSSSTPGSPRRPTRRWPRSPPRRSRRSPTTATTPPSGCCASATAPTSRTGGCRPGWTRSGRTCPSCSRPTRWSTRLPGVAVDPAALREPALAYVADVVARATLRLPDVDAGRRRWASRRAHRGARRRCSPRCRDSPGRCRG